MNPLCALFLKVARECCHKWNDPAIFLGSCTITSGGTVGVQILDTTESDGGMGMMVITATTAELTMRTPQSVQTLASVRARKVRSVLLANRAINQAAADPLSPAQESGPH
jgi:hypothetical protein